jgi:hypothetical protein
MPSGSRGCHRSNDRAGRRPEQLNPKNAQQPAEAAQPADRRLGGTTSALSGLVSQSPSTLRLDQEALAGLTEQIIAIDTASPDAAAQIQAILTQLTAASRSTLTIRNSLTPYPKTSVR